MAEHMSTHSATSQMVVFGLSDRGLKRDNNEDHFMIADLTRKVIGVQDNHLWPELLHHDIGARGTVLMVADGLGGHESGEIASQLAVDTVVQVLMEMAGQGLPVSAQLGRAINLAHEAIRTYHGATGHVRHMASTLTAVHVGQGIMTIAQIGDSRAYRFSAGKLTLVTEDQSMVYMMQKKGMLTPEEAQHHPQRNIILQALGQDTAVLPELQILPWQHNDCLLLCSDGLSSYVAHERIEAILASEEDEHTRCGHLVEEANAVGGADNVTVVLARLIITDSAHSESTSTPSGHVTQQMDAPQFASTSSAELPRPQLDVSTPQEQAEASPEERTPWRHWPGLGKLLRLRSPGSS